jgi:hypothetical protein
MGHFWVVDLPFEITASDSKPSRSKKKLSDVELGDCKNIGTYFQKKTS